MSGSPSVMESTTPSSSSPPSHPSIHRSSSPHSALHIHPSPSPAPHSPNPSSSASSSSRTVAPTSNGVSSTSSPTTTSPLPPPHSSDPSHPSHPSSIKLHLAEVPFFAELDPSKLLHLASFFEFRRTDPGEVICRQGDEANGFAIIVTGEVDVSVTGPGGGPIHLNTLKAGDWFGEIALTQNTLRTATLTSLTPCVHLYLSSSQFQTFLTFAPELRQGLFSSIISRRTANSLKAVPLFSFLSRPEGGGGRVYDESKLQLLGEMFRFQQFQKGEVVFREGDEADAFYIIQRGTVGVWARKGENDEELMKVGRGQGREEGGTDDEDEDSQGEDSDSSFESDRSPSRSSQSHHSAAADTSASQPPLSPSSSPGLLLTDLTKNDWFGEIALVSNTRRTATVITKTPCTMLKLFSHDFSRFMEVVPSEVKLKFSRVMNMRIAQTLSNIPFFRLVKEHRPESKLVVLGSMFQFEHFRGGGGGGEGGGGLRQVRPHRRWTGRRVHHSPDTRGAGDGGVGAVDEEPVVW